MITYTFYQTEINFGNVQAALAGTLTVEPSTYQYPDVDFYLNSDSPDLAAHYTTTCCGAGMIGTTFYAPSNHTHLMLYFNDSLGVDTQVGINTAQLDLTALGQPTYYTHEITGFLAPVDVPEPTTQAIYAVGLLLLGLAARWRSR